MSDAILSTDLRKAVLSYVYLSAIAAKAGYTCDLGPHADLDSIDATVRAGGGMRPQIDVQLKATAVADWKDDGLHYRLSRKNYNDLRELRRTPIILAVFELPRDETDWLLCDEERLVLRRSAWWLSLSGFPDIETDTKIVTIPKSQRLDPSNLARLMAERGRERCESKDH